MWISNFFANKFASQMYDTVYVNVVFARCYCRLNCRSSFCKYLLSLLCFCRVRNAALTSCTSWWSSHVSKQTTRSTALSIMKRYFHISIHITHLVYINIVISVNWLMYFPFVPPQDGDDSSPVLTSCDIVKVPDPQMGMVRRHAHTVTH